jgi:prepilin-type N-terminal cleavage/methylation domain-containing protein
VATWTNACRSGGAPTAISAYGALPLHGRSSPQLPRGRGRRSRCCPDTRARRSILRLTDVEGSGNLSTQRKPRLMLQVGYDAARRSRGAYVYYHENQRAHQEEHLRDRARRRGLPPKVSASRPASPFTVVVRRLGAESGQTGPGATTARDDRRPDRRLREVLRRDIEPGVWPAAESAARDRLPRLRHRGHAPRHGLRRLPPDPLRRGVSMRTDTKQGRGRRAAGFTLIEVLIVIAIVSLMMVWLIPNLLSGRTQGEIQETQARLQQLASAAESYQNQRRFGDYPPDDFRDPARKFSRQRRTRSIPASSPSPPSSRGRILERPRTSASCRTSLHRTPTTTSPTGPSGKSRPARQGRARGRLGQPRSSTSTRRSYARRPADLSQRSTGTTSRSTAWKRQGRHAGLQPPARSSSSPPVPTRSTAPRTTSATTSPWTKSRTC